MPEIDYDKFIYEEFHQVSGFPILNGFMEAQWGEYENHEEWQDAIEQYVNANRSGFLAEVICYPAMELKIGCMAVFTPEQQEEVISECMNMKQPTETEVDLVHKYGTIQQYAKIKLKL